MPKRRIPLVTGSYRDSNRHWSRQECIGWMPVRAEQPGTLTEWQLRQLPGCKPFVYVGTSVAGEGDPVFTPAGVNRGLRNVEGKLFSVCGNQLYQISNSGVAIPRGTIPGVGRVSMAHNANGLGNELLVVNGYAGYVWNTQTQAFAKVTDTGYPGAFVADFVDQYLAQVEPGGRYWFHSDLADAHSYNTLDQYVAEGDPDRIVSLIVSHREVLVLGKRTIEPYVNRGESTGTFERASNTVIEVGCSARYSVKRMDGSPFWLDDQRLIRRLDGYSPVILSTDPVAQAFAECTEAEIAQAYAFTWEPAGHKVYYITVPGRFTFGFDAKTGQWHRRKTYGLNHWAVVDVVSWNGKWIAADSRSSKLYELDDKYPLDECEPLERELTAPTVWADQNPITLDSVELMLDAAGQSVECIEFPDQPVGPGISGDAPDGEIGEEYPGYSYTITPGDAAIVSVVLVSGSLPDGLTLSNAGVISSGEVGNYGVFPFRVRVTDANGLWAELSDSITIPVVVEPVGTSSASMSVTSLEVDLPEESEPGGLLLMQVCAGSASAVSITDPTDWTRIGGTTWVGSDTRCYAYAWFYRIADADTTISVGTSGASGISAQVWFYPADVADVSVAPEVEFGDESGTITVVCPEIEPSWGAAATIAIAAYGTNYSNTLMAPSAWPYPYVQEAQVPGFSGTWMTSVASCTTLLASASIQPTAWTIGDETSVVASTVAVKAHA